MRCLQVFLNRMFIGVFIGYLKVLMRCTCERCRSPPKERPGETLSCSGVYLGCLRGCSEGVQRRVRCIHIHIHVYDGRYTGVCTAKRVYKGCYTMMGSRTTETIEGTLDVIVVHALGLQQHLYHR